MVKWRQACAASLLTGDEMTNAVAANGINYATLFPVFSGSGFVGSQILSALYGSGSPAAGISSGVNPIMALQLAQKNKAADIANEEKQPQVQHAIAAFTNAVKSATSIQSLLQNPDFLQVFLTANGLGSEVIYTALAKQALMSDPSDSKSVANQLFSTNSGWLSTVKTYNFFLNGLSAVQNPAVLSTIASGYAEVQWRQSLDQQTPGLSNALYFLQNASTFTSADLILGNSVARSVVTTAFGIPPQIAYQPLQAQEQVINNHVDYGKMSDSTYVQTITDQYLVQMQSSGTSSVSSSYLTRLFA